MDVITIESQAYKDLVTKINAIAKFVVDHQDDDTVNPDEMWVDSYEVCTFLKISVSHQQTPYRKPPPKKSVKHLTFSEVSPKKRQRAQLFQER